jgi:hypothetical protein
MNKPTYNYADITDTQYPASKTHYFKYWKDHITDIYDVNTHILSTRMFISGELDIYKIYNYKNSYYIISEITEYDPTLPRIYEVKLLRVNNLDAYSTTNSVNAFYCLWTMILASVCDVGYSGVCYSNSTDPDVGDYFYKDSALSQPWDLGSLVYIPTANSGTSYAVSIVDDSQYKKGFIMAKMDFTCTGSTSGYTGSTSCVQITDPLKFSFLSGADACSQVLTDTYYGNNSDFATSTTISANNLCTNTLGGYFSNGVIWKYTADGNNFISSGSC